ncbi:MFS transporter [Janibacter sp. DB-40]|uniref:MFS transporter n=1 Tax=Janibacter sp. DB-40 TaxID=3028808 RepID=UPI0024068F27|nr:MFS transporter [Janibacter sp. DB-40]
MGLTIALFSLWPLEHGLTVTQVLTLGSVQGVVILLLELPTSGFADAFGRRPVLIAAAVTAVASMALYLVAASFWVFAAAMAVQGVFRALDSGPLEAWYVDSVHAHRPGADVDQELSRAGTVLGASIALGALASGGLVLWDPLPGSALRLPFMICLALTVVHLVAIVVLLREPPRAERVSARSSVREAPRVVRSGLQLVTANAVLLALLGAEAAISLPMIGFEGLVPLRLAELLGSEEAAGALMSPVAAAGWAVYAGGAAVGGWLSARIGVGRAAMVTHLGMAGGVVAIGLATGPAGVVLGYLAAYGIFGGSGPLHASLVHREAEAGNRTTVLSLGSMVGFAVFAVSAPLAGLLADATSLSVGVVVLGVVSGAGVLLYLPALRAESDRPTPKEPVATA